MTDIDRIKTEVNRQASLCTCSKKYDVQQVAEGRYRVSIKSFQSTIKQYIDFV